MDKDRRNHRSKFSNALENLAAATGKSIRNAAATQGSLKTIRKTIKHLRLLLTILKNSKHDRDAGRFLKELKRMSSRLSVQRDVDVLQALIRDFLTKKKIPSSLAHHLIQKLSETLTDEARVTPYQIKMTAKHVQQMIFSLRKINVPDKHGMIVRERHRLKRQIHKWYQKSRHSKKADDLHAWRRNVKDMMHFVSDGFGGTDQRQRLQSPLKKLARELGWLNDIYNLEQHLKKQTELNADPNELKKFTKILKNKRKKLILSSLDRGQKVVKKNL